MCVHPACGSPASLPHHPWLLVNAAHQPTLPAFSAPPPPARHYPTPPPLQTAEFANPSYLGVDLPFSIYQLAWANSILMGGVELLRNSELDPEKRLYPGERRG